MHGYLKKMANYCICSYVKWRVCNASIIQYSACGTLYVSGEYEISGWTSMLASPQKLWLKLRAITSNFLLKQNMK
jgi:hypothetical protein